MSLAPGWLAQRLPAALGLRGGVELRLQHPDLARQQPQLPQHVGRPLPAQNIRAIAHVEPSSHGGIARELYSRSARIASALPSRMRSERTHLDTTYIERRSSSSIFTTGSSLTDCRSASDAPVRSTMTNAMPSAASRSPVFSRDSGATASKPSAPD